VRTCTEVGRVNLGLDWVNLGPAGIDGQPSTPGVSPVDHWVDVEEFPVSDWQHEVAAGRTRLGYAQWVAAKQRIR
jgi:hypothetical protein